MRNNNSDEENEDDDDSANDVLPDKAITYTEAGTTSTNPKPHGLNIPKLDLAKAFKI